MNKRKSMADPRYFWAKVVATAGDDGCWEWQGTLTDRGYGLAAVILDGIKYQRAHRVAFHFATGLHPGELFVLHRCDNRRCVNPDHLFLGDHNDNMADMAAKGRRAVGEAAGHNKLTTAYVLRIKIGLQQGRPQNSLAREFHISNGMVNHIAKGRQWNHVEVSA